MTGWPEVPVRKVLEPRNEIVHPNDRPTGEALFVGLEHIESGTGERIGGVTMRLERLTGRKAHFHAGDIVYGYLRPYLNKVWLADVEGFCSVDQYVFRVDTDHADAFFVAAFLRSPEYLRRAPIDTTPGQLPRIRTDEVLSVRMPLPPLSVQRAVASTLRTQMSVVDRTKRALGVAIDAAKSLRSKAYERAFRSIVPLANRPEADAPTGWRWVLLTDVARLETGHTPSRSRPDWWGGDIPWIALPDIRALDGRIAISTAESTNEQGIAHSSARVLPAGTVVLSRTASVGFVTRMGRPMATSQDFVNWICGPDLYPEFLSHLLIRARAHIRSLASGAVHKTVYFPTVMRFRVCIPSIHEQRAISEALREQLAAIDEVARLTHEQAEAVEALPSALLRRAFNARAPNQPELQ